jgi:lipid II:glycine glycyltransferase (peptidoglycan interpeptide bridge formation enzyme)
LIDYNNRSEKNLYDNLAKDKKENICKAVKNGICVEQTDNFRLLYDFVCLSFKRQNKEFKIPFEDLKRLDNAIIKNGKRVILKAFDNSGKIHALIYVVYNHKSAYQLLSGSDYNVRNLGGHILARREAIKFFIDKTKYFNFGGSNIQSIEEHVRGYGGTITPYFHIYNEKLFAKENGIHYHFKQIIFHVLEIIKKLK